MEKAVDSGIVSGLKRQWRLSYSKNRETAQGEGDGSQPNKTGG